MKRLIEKLKIEMNFSLANILREIFTLNLLLFARLRPMEIFAGKMKSHRLLLGARSRTQFLTAFLLKFIINSEGE